MYDDYDKGVYLVRRRNSEAIKSDKGGNANKKVLMTDIFPFGEFAHLTCSDGTRKL